MVTRNGEEIDSVIYGLSSLENRTRLRRQSVFPIASLTKQFVATAVMLLVRDGRLQLEHSVAPWFPESGDFWSEVTVRDLLCHLSGISDELYDSVDDQQEVSEDELVEVIASAELKRPSGTKWEYCNSGYVLLGALIHRVTGQFYGDVLFERIFFPLGMRDAVVYRQDIELLATGYESDGKLIDVEEWIHPSHCTPADGGLCMSIDDLSRWACALDRGFPSWGVLNEMWTPARLRSGLSAGYSGLRIGMGWMLPVDPRMGDLAQHEGAFRGFSSYIGRSSGFTVAILANIDDDVSELKLLGQEILRAFL